MTDPALPDEVITRSLVRRVDLPDGAGTAALITLDNGLDHTRPSTFGPAGLADLSAALDEASGWSDLAAVCITGKPFIFAVGADLSGVPLVRDRADAVAISQLGHAVFRRLGEMSVPTFAFVNGAAMGGGLELALHCTYRTVSAGAAALSLPECFLGLVPGWGGAYLLPRLVGPEAAVTVIIENALNQNRQLKPAEAGTLGLADVVLEPADFVAESLRWAARVVSGAVTVDRAAVEVDEAAWETAIARGRAIADGRTGGAAPAPYRALELIAAARTASRDEGFAAEDEALSDLIMTDELRAGLYAFDLVQKRARRPAGEPDRALARRVTKVGIVGAGLMAGQLALLFARRLEVPVVLTDLDQQRVDQGVSLVHDEIDRLASKRRITSDKANRLKASVTGTTDKTQFADADFVLEAVFEDLKVKQQVFAEVEAVVSETCVLATNTSSLSVSEMAQSMAHPERVVGFHFFNPVAIMPLLEIVQGEATDEATLATAFATGKALKKTRILVQDSPSFIVNRLLGRMTGEVSKIVDEGTPFDVADSAFAGITPMPPFVLLALVGPAIALHNSESLVAAYPDRFYVSANLRRVVEAGKSSIYTWDGGEQRVDPDVAAIFQPPTDAVACSREEVRDRVLAALADEVSRMLSESVVAAPQDLDLAMITGAGFPFWNGGLTPLLDREGVSERVTGRRFLPRGAASLP